MDIEKLKLILDAIGAVSDKTASVVIWYFCLSILMQIIQWGAVVGIVFIIAKTVMKIKMADEPDLHLSLKQQAYEAVRRYWLHGSDSVSSPSYKLYISAKEILGVRD